MPISLTIAVCSWFEPSHEKNGFPFPPPQGGGFWFCCLLSHVVGEPTPNRPDVPEGTSGLLAAGPLTHVGQRRWGGFKGWRADHRWTARRWRGVHQ
jgi:hypothetical protein